MANQKKKYWTLNERIRLAETVFEKRHLFVLTIEIKRDSGAWTEIANTMNAQQTNASCSEIELRATQVSSKWGEIMKDFSTGNLKGNSKTLFNEVEKFVTAITQTFLESARDGGASSNDNNQETENDDTRDTVRGQDNAPPDGQIQTGNQDNAPPEESEFDKDVNKTDPAILDTAALPHADRQSLTSDDGVSSSTLPAAGGNSPTRDEQNKKRVQDSIHILTGFFEKLTLEIPKMERGLRDLSECYETLKRELDELKKTE